MTWIISILIVIAITAAMAGIWFLVDRYPIAVFVFLISVLFALFVFITHEYLCCIGEIHGM